jgi:hypothetical protein
VQSALFPAAVAAVFAVLFVRRTLARRRFERTNVSGGRKALVLNLDRSRW